MRSTNRLSARPLLHAWLALSLGLASCGDGDDADCFSPTQNLDHAYDDGAYGCSCEGTRANNAGYCLPNSVGAGVALVCTERKWQAVIDGPCWPPGLITPELCEMRGGEVLSASPIAPSKEACPDGRKLLGAITEENATVPCCKKE